MSFKRMKKSYIAPLVLLLVSFLIGMVFLSIKPGGGAEAAKQKILTVTQGQEAQYCGEEFIDRNGNFVDTNTNTPTVFDNDLFYSFIFKLDGEIVDIDPGDIHFFVSEPVIDPGQYSLTFTLTHDNVIYENQSVSFTVHKRLVTVLTLLNGKTVLTIPEGSEISLSYDYQNAIPKHTVQVYHNGVSVTEISNQYMRIPASTDVDTTRPVENFPVAASRAESDYYDFNYIASYLTITPSVTKMLTYVDGEVTRLIMVGNFSVLHSVDYTQIGINPSNSQYAVISAAADALYKDNGFFDKYEKVDCFSVKIQYNNNKVYESVPSDMVVQLPLDESKKYKVVALYANGQSEVLDTKYSDGLLSFRTTDVGDFLVVTEIEGLSLTSYALIIVGAISLFLILVLLIFVFRRKY